MVRPTPGAVRRLRRVLPIVGWLRTYDRLRSWVASLGDLIVMFGSERSGVAGGLREADHDQRQRHQCQHTGVVEREVDVGHLERRRPAVRSVLDRAGVIDRLGPDHLHGNVHRAVAAAQRTGKPTFTN